MRISLHLFIWVLNGRPPKAKSEKEKKEEKPQQLVLKEKVFRSVLAQVSLGLKSEMYVSSATGMYFPSPGVGRNHTWM